MGDYLPSSSVFHRLSAELYSLSFPAISTWGAIRQSMATNGSHWPSVLSEELPESLSLSGRENEDVSFEATTSRRVSSRQPRVPSVGPYILIFPSLMLSP